VSAQHLALKLLRGFGAYRVGGYVNRHRLLVLTYHKVLPDTSRDRFAQRPATIVYASEFERQIAHLARRYHVLTGESFGTCLADRRDFPARAALSTFDDGYENNYLDAFPILRRVGVTALFFLTTDFVGHEGSFLWFDRLDAVLGVLGADRFAGWAERRRLSPDRTTPAGLRAWIKTMAREQREALLSDLEDVAGTRAGNGLDSRVAGPMTWDQVRTMAEHGMTVGSHTASHQILASTSADEVRSELVTSRGEIEARLDRPCWSFSYPNGERSDFRPADQEAVKTAGYDCAFTQMRGFVAANSNPYAFPRMPVRPSSDLNVFLSRISGVWTRY